MDVAQSLAVVRRWWWLLILGVLFSVAAYGVSVRVRGDQAQPTYTASTTLFVTLPPLPASSQNADGAKRPWELDRLMATYAEMAKSRTVAARAVQDDALPTTPDDLASRISTTTFGYTQLLRITIAAPTSEGADLSVAAVARAFTQVRSEQSIPGEASVYETATAVRTDSPMPLVVNIGIVIMAGLLASAAVVFAFERLRPTGLAGAADQHAGGEMLVPAANERAA